MANTTFNPSDKSAGATLSGGNLTVTATSSPIGVRAIDRQVSGKFYWEHTINVRVTSSGFAGGIAPSFTTNTNSPVNPGNTGCGVLFGGNIQVDGANTGITLGAIVAGNVVCFAVDLDARLMWFRVGAAGNWNANASYNPATGVGGVAIINLGRGIPAHPASWLSNNTDQIKANFGDTAFTGAVPSGYTSGFTAATDTVLLVHADGTHGSIAFTDVSRYAHSLSPVSAFVSTTSPKFGTGSGDFTAAGSRVVTGSSQPEWNFGAGQFTIEAWAYLTVAPTGVQIVVGRNTGSTNLGWNFGMNAGTLYFSYSTTGTDSPVISASYTPTLNAWIHLAVDRDTSNVVRVYADGAVIASATVSASFFASTNGVVIGNDWNLSRNFPGRLDEIRITRGTARYGGVFTTPTAPFELDGPPTNALASQALAEHWLTTDPDAQITQVVAEHWASVASVVPAAGGPMVSIIQ